MAFIDSAGRVLTKEEVSALIQMVKDSIKNHSEVFFNYNEEYIKDSNDEAGCGLADTFGKVYADRINTIEQDYLDMLSSDNEINIEEVLKNEFTNLNKKAIETYGRTEAEYSEIDGEFKVEVLFELKDRNLVKEFPVGFGDEFDFESAKFKFADEPFAGIENIDNFNANNQRITVLNQPRSGNSTTLADSDDPKEKQALIENRFKFDAAAELSRLKASELKSKDNVTFLDIYNAFTELNQYVRIGDSKGGQLRGEAVSAGNNLYGASPNEVPYEMFKLTSNIAVCMNVINETQDPLLKKTRAVQLAAYTYQMALSAHLFADGNGRSCRLLADAILQTYDLPPHIPSREETRIGHTLGDGDGLDFNRGAQVFMAGVEAANAAIREAANGPKPVNSEITSDPDTTNAIRWYRSLGNVLKEKGLDTLHFRDVSKIRVLQDVQAERKALLDYDIENAEDISNPECVHNYLRKANVPAFLMTDGSDSISLPKPEPGKLVYEHPVNYIAQNVVEAKIPNDDKGTELSNAGIVKIKELYNMARNGRLNLYTGGEPEMEHTHALTVAENGLAHYEEKSFGEIFRAYENNEALTPVQRKIGAILTEYDEAHEKLKEIAEAQKNENPEAPATEDAYKKVFSDIRENINVDVTQYTEPLEGVAESDVALRNYTGPKPRFVNEHLLDRTYLKEVYEIPEGVSPEACSMIVFGAILADENMNTLESSSTLARNADTLKFKKDNFISNVILDPDNRFSQYSSAIKTGRKNGIQAINEIKANPEKAMKFLRNAVSEIVDNIKTIGSYEGHRDVLQIFKVAREMYKAIDEEPFKSGLNISAEDRKIIEYGKEQADLLDPLFIPNSQSLNENMTDLEKETIIAAQDFINYISDVRADARNEKHNLEDAAVLAFPEILEKAREEDWGGEEYRERFLACRNFDELLKVAQNYDSGYETGYGQYMIDKQEEIRDKAWQKNFLDLGINQWIKDTPADEARQRIMDVLTNTRYFRGQKAGVSKPVGSIKEQMAGIAPFARYNVRNVLIRNLAAIQSASGIELNNNEEYNAMIAAMKDMIGYIDEHPQNDLDPHSASEYMSKLSDVDKAIKNYGEHTKSWMLAGDEYQAVNKSVENVEAVKKFIDKEIKDFSKNIEEYEIHKDWDFEKEIKWYKSFSKMLADNGVDVTNPVSLLSVRIMGDLSNEARVLDDVIKRGPESTYVAVLNKIGKNDEPLSFDNFISQGYVPAYLKKDGQFDVNMPRNPKDAEPADFYFRNTVLMDAGKMPESGEGISAEAQFKIKELYKAAKEGRLFIDHTGERKDARPVMIDDNGEAKLSDKTAKDLGSEKEPANDFEKKVQTSVQNYQNIASVQHILYRGADRNLRKFYDGTVELTQKTTLMMKDYQANPGNYRKVADALKRSEVIGSSLNSPTGEIVTNLFSENSAGRVREYNKFAELSENIIKADAKVYFGSPQYDELIDATIKLTKISLRLAKQHETGTIEQANEYRQALLEVKQKAEAYIEYKGEVKDKKGIKRVNAAKAIAEYAKTKYVGVLGTVIYDLGMPENQKQKIAEDIKEAHRQAEEYERAREVAKAEKKPEVKEEPKAKEAPKAEEKLTPAECAEKLLTAFEDRLKILGDKKSLETLEKISRMHKDFVKMAVNTEVVKQMVDNPNLFKEKGQHLVDDLLSEMSIVKKPEKKQEDSKTLENAMEKAFAAGNAKTEKEKGKEGSEAKGPNLGNPKL